MCYSATIQEIGQEFDEQEGSLIVSGGSSCTADEGKGRSHGPLKPFGAAGTNLEVLFVEPHVRHLRLREGAPRDEKRGELGVSEEERVASHLDAATRASGRLIRRGIEHRRQQQDKSNLIGDAAAALLTIRAWKSATWVNLYAEQTSPTA